MLTSSGLWVAYIASFLPPLWIAPSQDCLQGFHPPYWLHLSIGLLADPWLSVPGVCCKALCNCSLTCKIHSDTCSCSPPQNQPRACHPVHILSTSLGPGIISLFTTQQPSSNYCPVQIPLETPPSPKTQCPTLDIAIKNQERPQSLLISTSPLLPIQKISLFLKLTCRWAFSQEGSFFPSVFAPFCLFWNPTALHPSLCLLCFVHCL